METQQLPNIEKAVPKEEFSCLKWTFYSGRKNVCINFQGDTHKVEIVDYHYWNNTSLKETEMAMKLPGYKKFPAERVYLLSYIDIFFKHCIILVETTVRKWFKICRECRFMFL